MPLPTTNLYLHLDAGTFGGADNDPIGSLADQSGNSFDGAASGSLRPTFKTNIINSLPVMRFGGAQLLYTGASASLTAYTGIAVIKLTGTGGYRPLVGSDNGSGGLLWRAYASSNVMNLVKDFVTDIASSNTKVEAGGFQIVAFTFTAASGYAFYIDGVLDNSGSHGQTFTGSRQVAVGFSPASGDYFSGDIAEIALYDAVLGSTDLDSAFSYLAGKYALPGGVGAAPANDYNDWVLLSSPQAYYPLDEASGLAVDISGNGYDMLPVGSPTRSETALISSTPSSGAAAYCDAGGDYFTKNLASIARLSSAWSVEAWVKPSAASQPEGGIVTSGYDGSRVPWVLGTTGTSNGVFAGFYNGSWRRANSTFSLTNGVTYHLVATWDGTDLKLYINGGLDVTNTPGSTPGSPTHSDYYIGKRWDSSNRFDGRIDEVAIYSTALSSTQVADNYTSGTGGTPTPPSGYDHKPSRAFRNFATRARALR